ncbi:IS66 family transposase [Photobacterium leiognathi subsp. mandapamensis]|uniref:IS66 family transposase n=1 Tax=Photobacterium leiognathi TaxID=553611 RepID=UPI003AF3956E
MRRKRKVYLSISDTSSGKKTPSQYLLHKSPVGKAGYALNQWLYLKRYIDNSLYSIDNNQVEREIRTVAVDR